VEGPPRIVLRAARTEGAFPMLLNKMPGFWVVTGWPAENVELRLRICGGPSTDPCELFFDVRLDSDTEFYCLGSVYTSLWGITHPREEDDDERAGYPSAWRRPFRHMARRWAACAWILEPRLSTAPYDGH
jgi:hypothetical protein